MGATAVEIRVPALGDVAEAGVVDLPVGPGGVVKRGDALVTLESDKATLDVPSPASGTVRELKVGRGDRVREGMVILTLELAPGEVDAAPASLAAAAAAPARSEEPPREVPAPSRPAAGPAPVAPRAEGARALAAPSVRRLARELGVDLARVAGTGSRGRILSADVVRFVKAAMSGGAGRPAPGALDLPPWPRVDFARFGPVETRPLSRIRRISAANLARNWVMIPHVTQHGEADVTDLEAHRARVAAEQGAGGTRPTLLAFVVKACVAALKRYPEVNASLDGDRLVLKRYFHVGFAADTPDGLLVPVIRDADRKGVLEIAGEIAALAARARAGELTAAEMQGGTFSISNLGGTGGGHFTPIVNAPEVAILGVARAATSPVWDGERFAPRLMLPLSLSYDHRVVDGVLGARFLTYVAELLGDVRRATE